jgi:hypothetical protein
LFDRPLRRTGPIGSDLIDEEEQFNRTRRVTLAARWRHPESYHDGHTLDQDEEYDPTTAEIAITRILEVPDTAHWCQVLELPPNAGLEQFEAAHKYLRALVTTHAETDPRAAQARDIVDLAISNLTQLLEPYSGEGEEDEYENEDLEEDEMHQTAAQRKVCLLIHRLHHDQYQILLTAHTEDNLLSLPGGYPTADEAVETAAARLLQETTSFRVGMDELHTTAVTSTTVSTTTNGCRQQIDCFAPNNNSWGTCPKILPVTHIPNCIGTTWLTSASLHPSNEMNIVRHSSYAILKGHGPREPTLYLSQNTPPAQLTFRLATPSSRYWTMSIRDLSLSTSPDEHSPTHTPKSPPTTLPCQ